MSAFRHQSEPVVGRQLCCAAVARSDSERKISRDRSRLRGLPHVTSSGCTDGGRSRNLLPNGQYLCQQHYPFTERWHRPLQRSGFRPRRAARDQQARPTSLSGDALSFLCKNQRRRYSRAVRVFYAWRGPGRCRPNPHCAAFPVQHPQFDGGMEPDVCRRKALVAVAFRPG